MPCLIQEWIKKKQGFILNLAHCRFLGHLVGRSRCPRPQWQVTTVTVWSCRAWRAAWRLSTTTGSAVLENLHLTSAATGASANKPSRTGSGGHTGTAQKARKETSLMWPHAPPSLRQKCGSRRGGRIVSSTALTAAATGWGQVTTVQYRKHWGIADGHSVRLSSVCESGK